MRIALVEVGHRIHEPAVGEAGAIRRCRVRILDGGAAVVGGREGPAVVDPVLFRQVAHPPMGGADVVEHHVHDQADPARPRLARQRTVVVVAAEARVDAIQVADRVAVVGVRRLVVLQQGRGPQLGETHAGDVVQVPTDAGDVAAVAAVRVRAVGGFLEAGDAVVGRIAVGEAIRHQQVNRIARIEAAALRGTGSTRLQPPRVGGDALAGFDEFDVETARLCIGRDFHGDEQVVRVVAGLHVDDGHARARQSRRRGGDALAVHQQFDPVVVHADPPVGRFQMVDGGRVRYARHQQQAGGKQHAHGDVRSGSDIEATRAVAGDGRNTYAAGTLKAGGHPAGGHRRGLF